MYKSFKDPIYGYISIEKEIVKGIVDTAAFQRLRNVIQTSYAPLYSSAVHNRFVHSLGVYHLGNIVSRTIETMFQNEEGWDLSRCLFVFKLATTVPFLISCGISSTILACNIFSLSYTSTSIGQLICITR
jgi:hypothetical protein